MELFVFDGNYDAYFWVLCVDKYCKVRGITEKEKMVLATTAMTGSALKWWCWWSPRHPGVSWNTFTIALLWRFKPEDRCILPIVDDNEEEPDQESSPLMKLDDSYEELNDVLKAWDVFLLSTEEIEVPQTRVVNAGNLDLSDVTTNEFIEKPQSLDDSLPIYDSLPPHHLVQFHGSNSLEDFHLDSKFHFPQFSNTFTPKTAISFNTALLRKDTLHDDLCGSSLAKKVVMLPLNFVSLFDPGGTHYVSTLPPTPPKPSDSFAVATSLLETHVPPEKPPYGDYHVESATRITLSIKSCLSLARRNVPMQSQPLKPPDRSFQLKPGEFQVLWDFTAVPLPPPLPPEPPDINPQVVVSEIHKPCKIRVMILLQIAKGFGHSLLLNKLWNMSAPCHSWRFTMRIKEKLVKQVLLEFATLKFLNLTNLRSLYQNRHSVVGSMLENVSILSQLVILDAFDSNPYSMVSILLSKVKLLQTRRDKSIPVPNFGVEGHHVLEAAINCFIERRKLSNCGILIIILLGDESLVASLKLRYENEKDIMRGISQTILFTSVHQKVTCRICCYYDFGSNALVLFEYPAHSALEIHLPQCTRNCLDMDCFSNLTFAEETTSFVAFLRYVHSSPIWCHDIKFSCILAKDDFSAIIARLGLLYGVVTSNLQWYLNCQCMHFCKTSICNMHVMLLGILLSVPISQVPYSELIFGPCGYNLNGRWFGVPQIVLNSMEIFQEVTDIYGIEISYWWRKTCELSILQSIIILSKHKQDTNGNVGFFYTNGSLQFQQWDPGGCFLVHGEGPLDLEATQKDSIITQQHCANFNLEDKVDFNGGSNVMIQITHEKIHLAKYNWLR